MIQPWLHYQKWDFSPVILCLTISPLSLSVFQTPEKKKEKKINVGGLEVVCAASCFHHLVILILLFHQQRVIALLSVRSRIRDGHHLSVEQSQPW